MPNRQDGRPAIAPTEMSAAYSLNRKDELLDAVLTAGALVAAADRSISPLERQRVLTFLRRHDLVIVPEAEIDRAFDRRIVELQHPGYVLAAAYRLRRLCGEAAVRLLLAAAEDVATADAHLDPRELEILDLLRITLRARAAPPPALYRSGDSADRNPG
jgi:tellurite resistance protein TerB